MLLVILGAGASYDSLEPLRPKQTDREENRPPLAAQLFDDRLQFRAVATRYPQAYGLFARMRSAGLNGTIEAELDRLQQEVAQHPMRARELAAIRFYIRDVIEVVTNNWLDPYRSSQLNHHALIEQLEFAKSADDRILLVTFNYDLYIEHALNWANHQMASLDDYVTGTSFALFKLHGSIDWSRQVTFRQSSIQEARHDGRLDATGLITYAADWEESDKVIRKQTTFEDGCDYVPAIAVPVQSKLGFQCPEGHIRVLADELRHVDRILTIGWKGQETRFLGLLKEHARENIRLVCVAESKEAANVPLVQLQSVLRRPSAASTTFGMGFSGLVSSRAIEQMFKS